jgi:hypothetical protein
MFLGMICVASEKRLSRNEREGQVNRRPHIEPK